MGLCGRLYGLLSPLHPANCHRRLRRLTDRRLLIISNVLIFFSAVYHTTAGTVIVALFTYDLKEVVEGLGMQEERTTGVSTYLLQATIGIYLLVTSSIGLHSSRKVDIRLLIGYYWLALVAIPFLFLFSVACVDFKDVLRGWIDHRWDTRE